MGRIVKVILVHIAITMLIGFILPSSQSPQPSTRLAPPQWVSRSAPPGTRDWSSTEWDQHNLIRPTYPPQDLEGRYLASPGELRMSGQERSKTEEPSTLILRLGVQGPPVVDGLLQDARDAARQKMNWRK